MLRCLVVVLAGYGRHQGITTTQGIWLCDRWAFVAKTRARIRPRPEPPGGGPPITGRGPAPAAVQAQAGPPVHAGEVGAEVVLEGRGPRDPLVGAHREPDVLRAGER